MQAQTLKAEVREGSGKGPARQLRVKGMIPAVFYGPGVGTTNVSVSPKELLRALSTELRTNVLIELDLSGKKELAMVKDIQVHPISRDLEHVDFYKVSADRPVEIRVPVVTTGRALGVQQGGHMQIVFRELPVRCMPDEIPASISVEVGPLEIGMGVKVSELLLPPGVSVLFPPDRRVVIVGEALKIVEEETPDAAAVAVAGAAAAPGTTPEGTTPAAPAAPATPSR